MSEQYTILIIDDDKFLVDMYSLKFREQNFNVEVSLGGEDALKKLREGFSADAILLDLVMPGVDGFDFLEAVQKENLAQGATIIILSNQGQDPEIDRAKSLGAHDYIVKASAIPSEVLDKVLAILKNK